MMSFTVPSVLLHPIALFAAFSNAQSPTSVTEVFQHPSIPVPASLEASVVTSFLTTETIGISPTFIVTYLAACPSAASPENDACRALGIYPVEIYNTQGGTYGGVVTSTAEQKTTSWYCQLGMWGDVSYSEARCQETVIAGGSTVTRTERISDSCALQGASVPLVVTAGVEQLYTYSWKGMLTDVAEFKSANSKELASIGCPARAPLTVGTSSPTTTSSPPLNTSSTVSPGSVLTSTSASTSTSGSSVTASTSVPASTSVTGSAARNVGGYSMWIMTGVGLASTVLL